MRVKRIGLKHHSKAAFSGHHIRCTLTINLNVACRNVFKPSNQAQQGGFSAARGADENGELPVLNNQVQWWDYLRGTKAFGDLFKFNLSHVSASLLYGAKSQAADELFLA